MGIKKLLSPLHQEFASALTTATYLGHKMEEADRRGGGVKRSLLFQTRVL